LSQIAGLPLAVPMAHSAGHLVRFYAEDDFLLTEVARFLDAALRVGGTAVVIATGEHRTSLKRRLSGFGAATDPHGWYSGRLVMLDAKATLDSFVIEGWPDPQAFDAVVGNVIREAGSRGNVVHAFGEMVALLCEDGKPEAALRLEEMWNELGQRLAFHLLCAYPSRLFASADEMQTFRAICCAHDRVCRSEQLILAKDQADEDLLVASWQQKAAALENEVARRRLAEETLLRREKELSDFVENAAEGLHRVASDGTILWANRAELEMLGYTHEEYVGRNVADFHVDAPVIESIMETLSRGGTLRDQPARLRCKDGSIKHVLIQSNACFEDGRIAYTRCFTRDATDRVARDQLLDQLIEASRVKDEFLAMLGHELRNPLSPIVTALQLMRLRGDTGMSREQDIIRRQVDHLVRLVDDLLDISKLTRGKIELKKEWVTISEVLTKAVEMSSPLLDQRSHRLHIDVEDGLQLEADPVRLAQIVSNLLTNAAHYTRTGGEVTLRAHLAEDKFVRIQVADTGMGMSPQLIDKVFDLFFQGPRDSARSEGGLGIGLALVRSLVNLHGGTVQAKSAGPGRGSEFTIMLPVSVDAPVAATVAATGQATSAPGQSTECNGLRVLLVDDNRDAIETLGWLLQAQGHDVSTAHDAVAALERLDTFKPDVAILDIGLPVMDGYELLARMRERRPLNDCSFVALTGYGQEADRERSLLHGFERHLVKPVDPECVLLLLQEVRRNRSRLGVP